MSNRAERHLHPRNIPYPTHVRMKGLWNAKPKLARDLIKLLTSASCFNVSDSAVILSCDPLAWFDDYEAGDEWPLAIYNIGRGFGWPHISEIAEPESDDDFFFGHIVVECPNITDAVTYIAEKKISHTSEAWIKLKNELELDKVPDRDNLRTVIIDFSLPFGGEGGSFEQLLSQMPGTLSQIRPLQGHVALMTSLLIALKCPHIQEIITLMPFASILQQPLAPCRDLIRTHIDLAAVVELPISVFQPLASVASAMVVFQKKPARSHTLFYNISESGDLIQVETQPWLLDFRKSLSGDSPHHGFSAEVKPGTPWTTRYHLPKTYEIPKGLVEFCQLTGLGDLFDVIPGIRFSREIAGGKGGHPVIRGRDVGKAHSRETLERFVIRGEIPDRVRAQKNDLLIQRIGASPSLTIVDEGLAGSVVGDTLFILRPRSESVIVEPIFQMLSSKAGLRLLATISQGVTVPTLSAKGLTELVIPILPLEINQQLAFAAIAEDAIRQRADRLASIRHSLLLADSKEEFEQQIIALKTKTEVFSSSISASEDVNFKIRNFYPYPLAFPYRLLDSHVEPAQKYQDQLRMAENILAFVASVTLALMEHAPSGAGIDLKAVWRGGISPGDWLLIATKGAGFLNEKKAGGLALALKSLWKQGKKETDFQKSIRELIRAKNDFKHDRGPRISEEFARASVGVADHLKLCMSALEFFVQFPIRLVCDLNIDRGSGIPIIDTLRCVGDHPGFPQEIVRYSNPLPKNTLFIDIKDGRWVTLFPFMTAYHCLRCQAREIYLIDRWQDKEATLKSFERGHVEKKEDIAEELEVKCRDNT